MCDRDGRAGFGCPLESGRRNFLVLLPGSVGIEFRRLGHISAVLEPDLERQSIVAGRDADFTAEEPQHVAIAQARARRERFAVDLYRIGAPERLHEGRTVQQVQQQDGASARSRQAQLAIGAGPYTQRQVGRIYATFTFDVANIEILETQIASSQRTTTGCKSISGATRNSSRTSR